MHVSRVELRGFRNLADAELELPAGITLIHGANGAGKTNLIEAVHFGLAGCSPRTRNPREMVAFGADLARVEGTLELESGERHSLLASVARNGERRHQIGERPGGGPPVSAFFPDHLTLVKGPPGGRRRHLDGFIAAIWPARAELRIRFGKALAQRNALLARIRAGLASSDALTGWDREFSTRSLELSAARAEATQRLADPFAQAGSALGLGDGLAIGYAPRSSAESVDQLRLELEQHRETDLARGYSGYGPHMDEIKLTIDGRSARRYASQGQQRATLLALLFAERATLIAAGCAPPTLLLDDVMSELDPDRRQMLAERLEGGGQALITATDPEQLPAGAECTVIEVADGALRSPVAA